MIEKGTLMTQATVNYDIKSQNFDILNHNYDKKL